MNSFLDKIPPEVKSAINRLQKAGFEAYIVGGCVRDLLREIKPEDWDVATNALPEAIQKVFPKSYSDNKFGTITARMPLEKKAAQDKAGNNKKKLSREMKQIKTEYLEIEITPYRIESEYSDLRHPDSVKWAKSIDEDLSRRDFTVNAIALSYVQAKKKSEVTIIDPFGGQKDIKEKIIRAVGNPNERFSGDALRLMRAARFAVTLGKGWIISLETAEAVKKNSRLLDNISRERVRDEFLKIMETNRAHEGIELLRDLGLLKYIIPELEEGYSVSQNKHHIYDIYKHSLYSLRYAAKSCFNKQVKIATLLHDVGKPRVKQGRGLNSTFYNHEVVGARMTKNILVRLKFSKKDTEKIVKLVRYHLFYYNVGEVGESSIRRLVRKVGADSIDELLQVRMADRIGSGCPKAEPYKLRHLRYLVEKTSKDAISVKMLQVNGKDVMDVLNITPGPKVGQILNVLLGYALEDPEKNDKAFLTEKIRELGRLTDEKLAKLTEGAEKEKETLETKRDEMTKQKYWVT